VFCKDCLIGWFAKNKTPARQPAQDVQVRYYRRDISQAEPDHSAKRVLCNPRQLGQLERTFGFSPTQYPCPSCRTVVLNPPLPDFTLKNAMDVLVQARGESSAVQPAKAIEGTLDAFF
jgi:hypothetical protein